ncbi:MAG TPA: arginine--tRNA ligase [Sedimentisphaerales bacterium]|nr:arginine--tRNA ligase [Sedimentisphaerales bacterium]
MTPAMEMLEERLTKALSAATGIAGCPAVVRPATDAKFGDYQANGVMGAAKKLKRNPRDLAAEVVRLADLADICDAPEIAGPGFINLRLKKEYIAAALLDINRDAERLGVEKVKKPQKIVVDYSGPNIAKEMHVGHLRSTILGDCIARMLEFQGHTVIRQNHIGDWGTQFGMLIALLWEQKAGLAMGADASGIPSLGDIEAFYKEAKRRYDADSDFAAAARQWVVDLQNHDIRVMPVWKSIVDESRRHYQPVYERIKVTLRPEHERGESAYADVLADVVAEMQSKGIAVESNGAICVFPTGFKNKDGNDLPFIIQKSDGAFLYATTDLAALRYRLKDLGAERIIYVTDARQKLHFEMLFAVAKMAGWVKDGVRLDHVMFGSVLGEDGKPFKTRSGESVKLTDLLDEAVARARAVVEEKNPDLPDGMKQRIAGAVGIGAVKYADYSNNLASDYVFSFDRMLALEGNTAPYMQYAYARVKSIERKAGTKKVDIASEIARLTAIRLDEPAELELAKHLLRYGEVIDSAASDYRPNYLTACLYDLAAKFSAFYYACPVLQAGEDKRPAGLMLCDLTARTIRHGLAQLLGIEVVEQM